MIHPVRKLLNCFSPRRLTPGEKSIQQLNGVGFCFVDAGVARELKKESDRVGMPLQFELRPDCRLVRVSFP
jgi:hypothetical protein